MAAITTPSKPVYNKHLEALNEDVLYHLGFSTKSSDMVKEFGNVRFVCLGGSPHRMTSFAKLLATEAGIDSNLPNLAEKGGRFVLYKVGSVLIADHGMGVSSLSIILHELFKLVRCAKCQDVTFFRMGTCGGLGVTPGTLVITTEALNTSLEPFYELTVLGKTIKRRGKLCPKLADELYAIAEEENMDVAKGKTVCANDFYEEQARLDGAFCAYTEAEKMAYLSEAHEKGVRNMEMECTCFAAQCSLSGIRAAIVCVALVNRMISDQVNMKPADYANMQTLPGKLMLSFLKKHNAFSA